MLKTNHDQILTSCSSILTTNLSKNLIYQKRFILTSNSKCRITKFIMLRIISSNFAFWQTLKTKYSKKRITKTCMLNVQKFTNDYLKSFLFQNYSKNLNNILNIVQFAISIKSKNMFHIKNLC